MKKYIIKFADGKEQDCMVAIHDSLNEAMNEITEYVVNHNKDLDMEDEDRVSPLDFKVAAVDSGDIGNIVPDFKAAQRYLGLRPHDGLMVCKRKKDKDPIRVMAVDRLVRDLNPRHIEALIALNELFTIAEAWNKADGFVPDFSNRSQRKFFPWFIYNDDAAGFVFAFTDYTASYAYATFGSRLCFKTEERAMQFGQRFADLYNEVFLER